MHISVYGYVQVNAGAYRSQKVLGSLEIVTGALCRMLGT